MRALNRAFGLVLCAGLFVMAAGCVAKTTTADSTTDSSSNGGGGSTSGSGSGSSSTPTTGMSCPVIGGSASGDFLNSTPVAYFATSTMNGNYITSATFSMELDNVANGQTIATGIILNAYPCATLGAALPASGGSDTVTAAIGNTYSAVTFTFGGQGVSMAGCTNQPIAFEFTPFGGGNFDSHLLVAETPKSSSCFLLESASTTEANTNVSTKTLMGVIDASD